MVMQCNFNIILLYFAVNYYSNRTPSKSSFERPRFRMSFLLQDSCSIAATAPTERFVSQTFFICNYIPIYENKSNCIIHARFFHANQLLSLSIIFQIQGCVLRLITIDRLKNVVLFECFDIIVSFESTDTVKFSLAYRAGRKIRLTKNGRACHVSTFAVCKL